VIVAAFGLAAENLMMAAYLLVLVPSYDRSRAAVIMFEESNSIAVMFTRPLTLELSLNAPYNEPSAQFKITKTFV